MRAIDRRQCLQGLAALSASALPTSLLAQTQEPFWALARQGGHVMLMRHAATESGIGDPPQFRLGDCSTQRNLSAQGREQARVLGLRLAQAGVSLQAVYSSAWCRCTDTARLAFDPHHRPHQVWPALNSFFQGQGDERRQTHAVLERARQMPAGHSWMLVTHQVNISALTGRGTAMGEVLLCRPPQAGDTRLTVLAAWSP